MTDAVDAQAGLEAVNKRNTVRNNEQALAILRSSGPKLPMKVTST